MATAWVFTMPAAGVVGALAYGLTYGIGGYGGAVVTFVLVVIMASTFFLRARRTKVTPDNVNNEWTGNVGGIEPTEATPARTPAPVSA